ncbi:MAG: phosphatidate cytidylyltransferase [Clostridiales bacterium]|nr:phosphatidate cytidylyltransferase [Clostridiales bacterium]MCD7752958.1 phosphatidate cytidylyltransferase [Clostridiales bacterium]
MASRILVACVGVPLIFVILLACPVICLAVALSILAAIGAYELLGATGYIKYRSMLYTSMVVAFLVPLWFYFDCNSAAAMAGLLIFLIILFSVAFKTHETVTLGHIGACLMGAVALPAMLSALLLLTDLEHYRYYVLLPFVSAFCSDGAALFVGMFFGKRKLAPVLSPKKTVEGSIGGIIGSVLACMIDGIVVRVATGVMPNLWVFVLYGLLGSVVSQFGDLAFSYIKRQFAIKDYGKLFLAHGGVLDRFDSVIFCAPLTAVMVQILPFFQFG